MQNLHINSDGNYVIGGEIFTEDELSEKMGSVFVGRLKQTIKTKAESVEKKAKELYNSYRRKHRMQQIESYLKLHPEVEASFTRFCKTPEDYIDEATRIHNQRRRTL